MDATKGPEAGKKMHRIIFQVGPVTLYSYGLLVAFGAMLSISLILRDARAMGVQADKVFDCMLAVLAGGLAGGRLLFVLTEWEYYLRHPIHVFFLQEGGMAIQGALAVGILSGIIMCRAKGLPFLGMSDLVAPYLALAQSLGRVGCFLNGCCYGRVTETMPAVVFPYETVMRIPTQVYSSLILLLAYAGLIGLRRARMPAGSIFAVYLVAYGVLRLCMDFFRGDNPDVLAGLALTQVLSIATIFCGAGLFAALRYGRRSHRKKD